MTKVDAALARFQEDDGEWLHALRVLKGELLVKRGKVDETTPLLAPLPPRFARSEAEVRRWLALGFATREKTMFEQAHRLADAHQPHLLADVHLSLANVASTLEEVQHHVELATELAKVQKREIAVVNALNTMTRGYLNFDRYAEALDTGERALARYRELGVRGRISTAAGHLGWAYLEVGDYETAEELFGSAARAAEEAKIDIERASWLNQLGNVRSALGDYAGADRYYAQAIAISRQIKAKDLPLQLANRARSALELRHAGEAQRLNGDALRLKREQKRGIESELLSLITQARIEAEQGQVGRAEQTLREVAAATKSASTRWEAQARLAQLFERAGRPAEADAEYRRAIETAAAARQSITTSELRLSFYNHVTEIFDNYVGFLAGAGRAEEALAVAEASRTQSLEEGLGIDVGEGKLDARKVAEQHDATILSYWLGRTRSFLWVVTPASITLHRLPAAKELETAIDAYRQDLSGERAGEHGTLEGSGARARELYRVLVEPAGELAQDARVIVVADGKLHALNFETLVHRDRYWIEDVIVSNAGSLQLLARPAAPQTRRGDILLVGDAAAVDPKYPPLRQAWKEISLVKSSFARYHVLHSVRATPDAYQAADPSRFEFLHFVAHGVATRKRPLDSAIILSRGLGGGEYKLYARDIVRNRLSARLVTISSCHGAGTRTYAGEGLVGLAWAFLSAGADQVIAALWEVNDTSTPQLMKHMYKSIRTGTDPAAALREAKLQLVRSDSAYRKPYYWAPFVVYSGARD